jgi:hypothetical protein
MSLSIAPDHPRLVPSEDQKIMEAFTTEELLDYGDNMPSQDRPSFEDNLDEQIPRTLSPPKFKSPTKEALNEQASGTSLSTKAKSTSPHMTASPCIFW